MIIAEIGLNHMGDEKFALHLTNELLKTKIDGITFQIRDKKYYYKRKHLALSENFYIKVSKMIKKRKKKFGIALDCLSIFDLLDKLNVDFIKIINDGLTNKKLVSSLVNKNFMKIYISTGVHNLNEIKKCLKNIPSKKLNKIEIVHTSLNTSIESVNLRSISFLKSKLNLPIAYGSHCYNHKVLYTALAFQPSALFFYVKGTKNMRYFDKKHSIVITKIKNLVLDLKKLSLSLGKYGKIKSSQTLIM